MNNHLKLLSVRVKYKWPILIIIAFLGLAVRLYGINLPLVESHQIRQAQTAMMTRNLYEDKVDIFHTRLDFFGNVPGHIIMEFPLMHAITALLYYIFGVHEIIGRLVSVVFSVGAMFLMYALARQFLPAVSAFAALILYTFSPLNIFFSRAFMPESSMMFLIIGAIYFFLRWTEKQAPSSYILSIIFAALACLAKPTAALIFAPILTAWFLRYKTGVFKRFDFWIYMILTMAPLILWGVYANYFNSTKPYITAGFGGNWIELIRTRGMAEHWFDFKFYKFLGGSIIFLLLTPLGFLGMVAGIFCVKNIGQKRILSSWLGAIIAYFCVLAGANSGHVYYHLPLLPLGAILFGFAVEGVLGKRDLFNLMMKRRLFVCLRIGFIFLILTGYGIGYFKFFKYMYKNRMPYTLEVVKIIRENTPENRFIILNQPTAMPGVETYYSHSRSWYFTASETAIPELETLRSLGATTYVAIDTKYGSGVWQTKKNKVFWNYLNEKYKPVAITDHYLIFDLRVTKNTK